MIESIACYEEAVYDSYFVGDNVKSSIIYRVSLDKASAGKLNRPAVKKLLDLYYEPIEVMLAGEEDREKVAQLVADNANIIKGFIFNGKSISTSAGSVKYSQITNMERLFAASVLYNFHRYLRGIDECIGTNHYNESIKIEAVVRMGELEDKIMKNKLAYDDDFTVAALGEERRWLAQA